jgi:hypothetical protein
MDGQDNDTDQAPPRLPLTEAAARLGKSVDAVRAMIRRGRLSTIRGNDGRLLVTIPPELIRVSDQASASPTDQARLVGDQVMTRLQAERDEALAEAEHWRMAAHNEALARVRAEATAEAKETIVAELRALLADARRSWFSRIFGKG